MISSMSKKTKFCPFRKVVERETNDVTGKASERERFQPCIGQRCMAYQIGTFNLGTCKRLEQGSK